MFRISIQETLQFGEYSYSKDCDSFQDFKDYLAEEGITKVNLKYRSILDDIPDFYEWDLRTEDFSESHLEWLKNKEYGTSKYLEIIYKKNKNGKIIWNLSS